MAAVKVSVIIPVYNAENFIQETIDTICHSTLNDIEILTVNDGSKDNTLSVLYECAKRDERIKVIDKPNGGIFDARNRGLQEAKGEFVCFCDHDDIVEPKMYEIMYKKATENHCDLAMCSTGKFAGGEKLPDWYVPDCILNSDEIIEKCFLPLVFNKNYLYHDNNKINISDYIWKCMISRKFIEENNLKLRRFVNHDDDRVLLLDILARVKKVVMISNVLYYWRVNPKSTCHSPKYVDDMYQKDLNYQNGVQEIMQIAGCDNNQIEEFIDFNSAIRYARMVWNEINHTNAKISERLSILKQIYLEDNFDYKVRESHYFLKNMFGRRIVCKLLQKKLTFLSYEFCNYYVRFRHKFEDKSFWVKLEGKVLKSASNSNS